MYNPIVRTDYHSLPVLKRDEIDDIAEHFLRDYQPDVFTNPTAIDIDGFLEGYLKATPDYQYLSNNMIYLGMTVFQDTNPIPVFNPYKNEAKYFSAKANTVIFDTRLVEEANQEHRYRFTAGHECGHLIFHLPYFLRQHRLRMQFGIDDDIILQCRRTDLPGAKKGRLKTDSDWLEWQANQFSGSFLMPKSAVIAIVNDYGTTPASVYRALNEIDPCCGSGGMFVQSLKFVDRHKGNRQKVSIIGQESNPDTWRLCKMNLAIRGIAHNLGDTNASTFTNDLHKDKTVDYIMANPPFNLKGWRAEDALTDDPRFMRAGYSVMPPVANANFAWILHMLSKLDVNHGVAGFLLANGALNAGDAEGTLRKEILERDRVEAIIVLPRNMFYSTDISVTLWIVNMNKKAGTVNGRQLRDRTHEVLFMDLRRWDENIEEIVIDKGKKKKKTVLSDAQIAKIKEVYSNWQSTDTSLYSDVPEFCRSVKLYDSDLTEEERQAKVPTIESKGYSLAPSKYIEFIDHDLEIDYEAEMTRIQAEMRDIISAEKKSQTMLEAAFRGIGYGID